MTGRQEYDRTKDRQRILGKYMIDGLPILRALVKTGDSSPIQMYPCRHHILYLTVANSIGIAILHGLAI